MAESDAARMLRLQREWQKRNSNAGAASRSSGDRPGVEGETPASSDADAMLQAQREWATQNPGSGLKTWHLVTVGAVAMLGVSIFALKAISEKTDWFDSASKRCETAVGRTYTEKREDVQAAVAPCREAVTNDPKDVESLYSLGRVEIALGNTEAGLQSLRQAAALGHGKSTLELAIVTKSPATLHDAVAAFRNEAATGTPYAAFAYARVNLWADNFELKPHHTMLGDGTYALFEAAAQKGALQEISNLAYKFSDPSKIPGEANALAVSDALYTIAADQGFASATAGLAQRAFVRSRVAARDGYSDAASSNLDESERLARLALSQAGGKDMTAGLLLEDIKEVRERPMRMWAALFGGLAKLGAGSNSGSDGEEEAQRQREHEESMDRMAKNAECLGLAIGGDADTLVEDAMMMGC